MRLSLYGSLLGLIAGCGDGLSAANQPDSGGIQVATLKVTPSGSGTGLVTSVPAGIRCGTDCEFTFAAGTEVTLSAVAAANNSFTGWSNSCLGPGSCTLRLDSDLEISAVFEAAPNVVFLTRDARNGDLGGLAGADEICRRDALTSGLEGTYVAFLSTDDVDAISRLGNASGWVRPDGKPVFTNVTDRAMFHPITLAADGELVARGLEVWTATAPDGLGDGQNCDNWTSGSGFTNRRGLPTATTENWTTNSDVQSGCLRRQFYCFGVDRSATLDPPPTSGRLVFVSEGLFRPGGGLEAADALCAREAATAQIPGTFKALLGTNETGIGSARFDLSGPAWVRPDGIALGETASDLGNLLWPTPINVTLTGEYIVDSVWTGARANQPSEVDIGCDSWSSSEPTVTGTMLPAASHASYFSLSRAVGCDESHRLICVQE